MLRSNITKKNIDISIAYPKNLKKKTNKKRDKETRYSLVQNKIYIYIDFEIIAYIYINK